MLEVVSTFALILKPEKKNITDTGGTCCISPTKDFNACSKEFCVTCSVNTHKQQRKHN